MENNFTHAWCWWNTCSHLCKFPAWRLVYRGLPVTILEETWELRSGSLPYKTFQTSFRSSHLLWLVTWSPWWPVLQLCFTFCSHFEFPHLSELLNVPQTFLQSPRELSWKQKNMPASTFAKFPKLLKFHETWFQLL